MYKRLLIDTLGWGFSLWVIGYILGIAFFFIVPLNLIGWFITPIATIITLLVLFKRVQSINLNYYLKIAVTWTIIAILFDYFFIVQLLNPEDGYYKPDIYLYYLLTFTLPLIVGWLKQNNK